MLKKPLCIYAGKTKELQAGDSTYWPVDLAGRSTDYLLKVGETAYLDFTTTSSSVPLHVQTQEGIYELDIIGDRTVAFNLPSASVSGVDAVILQPNNNPVATASSAGIFGPYSLGGVSGSLTSADSFIIAAYTLEFTRLVLSTMTKSKSLTSHSVFKSRSISGGTISPPCNVDATWNNTSTAWTSLGTLIFPYAHAGKIVIRRII